MKQILAFLTSDDFEDFTSQLIGQELPNFVAVEGAGGDGGLDGLEGTTAYQMYFPEPKNRDLVHYIAKIDNTLGKLQKTIAAEELEVTRWVLVVPEDLHFKAVIHLQKKTRELGIECVYWGATKLTALLASHPQIRDNFPEIFLPGVKRDLGDVKTSIAKLNVPRTEHNVEIISDEDYMRMREVLREELRGLYRSAQSLGGSATEAATHAYRGEMDKKFGELDRKKAASDRAYELDLADINDHFEQELAAKHSDLAQRNVLTSGFGQKELHDINERRHRETERLRMKYGKTIGIQLNGGVVVAPQ